MTKEKVTAFPPTAATVRLGDKDYELRECPLARVRKFQEVWGTFFEDVNKFQAEAALAAENGEDVNIADTWNRIIDLALDKPYEILSILIPKLPLEPFEDEENGVTIPQILDAFEAVLEVNRIGWLKKLTPFFQNLILTTNLSPDQSA
jgi:hypothetical protein